MSHPKPKRKRGSPGPDQLEAQARDAALDKLATYRAGLVDIARAIAISLAKKRRRITSVEVFAEMRAQGYDEALDAVDPRWMGAVFNEGIWKREGFETTGSHKRPVAIWSLRNPANIPLSPRERVYRAISAKGEDGATVEDVELATGMTRNQVRAALDTLLQQDQVLPTGGRRRNSKRRKMPVYVLPQHHPELA